MIDNALIMGNIYDPETDCQYVLLRVTAKDWDKHQQELELDNEINCDMEEVE
jgi:uncharacterized protein YuzE